MEIKASFGRFSTASICLLESLAWSASCIYHIPWWTRLSVPFIAGTTQNNSCFQSFYLMIWKIILHGSPQLMTNGQSLATRQEEIEFNHISPLQTVVSPSFPSSASLDNTY
ncbi:hypothetical protein BX666DRAFT_904476 [Dichotomocladium elegans]|nr:hypothetical protein BX666DRAFT_904476 [Dichotomocladium elegans]